MKILYWLLFFCWVGSDSPKKNGKHWDIYYWIGLPGMVIIQENSSNVQKCSALHVLLDTSITIGKNCSCNSRKLISWHEGFQSYGINNKKRESITHFRLLLLFKESFHTMLYESDTRNIHSSNLHHIWNQDTNQKHDYNSHIFFSNNQFSSEC